MALRLLVVAVALAVATRAQALEPLEKLVVLPFDQSKLGDDHLGDLLYEVLLSELSRVVPRDVAVLGASDLEAMLGHAASRIAVGCDASTCLVEIGNAMGASHLAVPAIGKVGSQYVINLKVVGAANANVVHRQLQYVSTDEDAVLAGVKAAVAETAKALSWEPGRAGAGPSWPIWGGSALVGVGAAAALGFGYGVYHFNAAAGAADALPDERRNAGVTGLGMIAGVAAGAAAAVAGGAWIGVTLWGEE